MKIAQKATETSNFTFILVVIILKGQIKIIPDRICYLSDLLKYRVETAELYQSQKSKMAVPTKQ